MENITSSLCKRFFYDLRNELADPSLVNLTSEHYVSDVRYPFIIFLFYKKFICFSFWTSFVITRVQITFKALMMDKENTDVMFAMQKERM